MNLQAHSQSPVPTIELTEILKQTSTTKTCVGLRKDGTMAAMPQVELGASRQAILDYFDNGWALTELLFSGLATEAAFYERPYHQLRHPMIFYYAHPAALYANKLRIAGLLEGAVDAEYEVLFEAGVDEMRWDNLHENRGDIWPSVAKVRAYRKKIHKLVKNIITTHPLLEASHLPITQKSPLWALAMAFEHERIHFETSTVLVRELPLTHVRVPAAWPKIADQHGKASALQLISVKACNVTLGKPLMTPTFGWDNEYGSETRHVSPFAAASTLTSNGEFLEFVKAGGYSTDRYWSREGLAWRKFRNTKCPTFWVAQGPDGSHEYGLRTIFSNIALPSDWPVCTNFHEAKAYCMWLTERDQRDQCDLPYRLLTEAEHNAIRAGAPNFESGSLVAGSEHGVASQEKSELGFHDVFGNLWQWCEDHFHPLPGAEPHRYYADFSTPCYDSEHQMILGGSFVSTGDETSRFARFHFRPHFFQHAGFRIARSVESNPTGSPKKLPSHNGSSSGSSLYETDEMLNKYLLMHFGTAGDMHDANFAQNVAFPDVVHLPKTCAELVLKFSQGREKALDLGCAVGRSTFELARDFSNVVGIDFSHEFIDAANRLKQDGKLPYFRKDSGSEGKALVAKIDPKLQRERITFTQGDACTLPSSLEGFDAVLLANTLCRLPDPAACLARMQGANGLVRSGGVLVMTTPLSWLAEYTSPARWLNGLDAIAKHLSEFELVHQRELPFMIREHRRKFEYIITQASIWRRK